MDLTIKERLEQPFPATKIHWRVGSTNAKRLGVKPWEATKGSALAYVDARDVMKRLDGVLGAENWQARHPLADSGLLICEVGIRASIFGLDRDDWVWKANGAGDTQVEAEKGKCSDAFKRAAVLWGVGQYLYALPNQWHDLENGRFSKGTVAMLGETLPLWATPDGYQEIINRRKSK